MDQHQWRQKDSPVLENISETSKNTKKKNRKKQIFLTEIQIFSDFDLASVASSLQEQNNNQDAQEIGKLWLENIEKAYLKNKNENEHITQAWPKTRYFRAILDNSSSQSRATTTSQCPQKDGAKRGGWDETQRMNAPTSEIIYQGSRTTL